MAAFLPVSAITAVGACAALVDEWAPSFYDEQAVLAAGEGIRAYQPDAGTASDTRRFVLDIEVDEFVDF